MENLEQPSGFAGAPAEEMSSPIEYFFGILQFRIGRSETNHFLTTLKPGPGFAGKYIRELRQRERHQRPHEQQSSAGIKRTVSLENVGCRANTARRWRPAGDCQEYWLLHSRSVPQIPMQ